MGSTLVARRAGKYAAIRVTREMASTAAPRVSGSDGVRPKSWDWMARLAARVAGTPRAIPIAEQ